LALEAGIVYRVRLAVVLSSFPSGLRGDALLIGPNWTSYHPTDAIEAIS
jgi:hypothetical protein